MKQLLAALLLMGSLAAAGQNHTRCMIFQYAGTDSLNQKLVSEEFYNAKGQLTSYYYSRYKSSPSEGYSDSKYVNFYRDTLLIRSAWINETGDSGKTSYSYNAAGQKTREEHFSYKRRLKKNSDKGNGRPGGCIVTDADYEKERTWEKTSEIHFSYDSSGNKILYDATGLHFSTQNKYTWIYDNKNRVVTHHSYDHSRLIWTEQFTYFDGGYTLTRTWFDYEGNPSHLKEKNHEYWPQYTFTYTLNARGQVTSEKVTDEKGTPGSSKTMRYNAAGKLISSTTFDAQGQPGITHNYSYN